MTDYIGDYENSMKLVKDPLAQMEIVTKKTHITLPASYLGKVKEAVATLLNGELQSYSSKYDGIPVAYNRQNVKLLSRVGNILAAQSCVHFDVETDFIVFKPSVGSILKGVVNKRSKRMVGCLVHNFFYASVNCHLGQAKKTNLGDVILFKVVKLEEDGQGFLSIIGSYEKTLKTSSNQVHTEDDSGIDDHDSTHTPSLSSGKHLLENRASLEVNNSFDVRASVASSHDISAQGKTPAADQTPSGKKAKKKKKEKKEKKEKKKKGDKKKKKHKKDKKVRDDSIAAGEELPAAENTVANASSLTATGSERIHASHSAVDGSLPGPLPKKSQAPKQTEMDRMSASESETTLVARHDRDRLIADDGAARKAAKRKKKDKKLPDPPEASAAALDSPPAGENLQQSFWVFANAGTAGGRAIGQSLLPEIPSLLKTETPAITPGELFEPAAHVRERAETASKGKTRKSNSRERDDEGAAVPASSKTGAKQETNSGATLLPGHNEGWSSVDEAIDAVVKAALKSAEEKEEKPGTEQINPPAGLQQAIVASPSRASDAGSTDLFEEERPKVEGVNSKTTAAKSRKRKLFDEDERMLTSVKKAKSAPSDAAQTTAPPTAASNEEMARFYLATLGLRLNSDGSTSPIKPKKKKAEKKVGKAEKKS